MKSILTILSLLLCIGVKAQIGITAYGGYALYSATSVPELNDEGFDREGKGGYQLGLEVTKGFGELFYAGIGAMAHRPTINMTSVDDTFMVNANGTEVSFGNPAISFYATAGVNHNIVNIDLSAGISLGYTVLSGDADLSTDKLTTADGGGLYAGLNLGAAYRIAGPLSIGLRTGIQYHALSIDNPFWDGSTSLLAVPIALTIGVKF